MSAVQWLGISIIAFDLAVGVLLIRRGNRRAAAQNRAGKSRGCSCASCAAALEAVAIKLIAALEAGPLDDEWLAVSKEWTA